MYLSQLKLWNFRKFGNDSFDLSQPHLEVAFTKGLNVLIGENDSGKSSIVDAIKLALRTHSVEWIAPSDDDFYDDAGNVYGMDISLDSGHQSIVVGIGYRHIRNDKKRQDYRRMEANIGNLTEVLEDAYTVVLAWITESGNTRTPVLPGQ